jgi:hypothetical protein
LMPQAQPLAVANQATLSTPDSHIEQFGSVYAVPEQDVADIPEHPDEQLEQYPLEHFEAESVQPVASIPEQPVEQFEPVYAVSKQVVPIIPERPIEQYGPLSMPALLKSQRMKASRLVPMRSNGQIHVPEQDIPTSPVSWRCPNCKIPFKLNGDTCYCRRCGLARPLDALLG